VTSLKMARMRRLGVPWGMKAVNRDDRTLVCTRCGKLMYDAERFSGSGEFFHKKRPNIVCPNDNKTFYVVHGTQLPEKPNETSLFERKKVRRAGKRAMRRQRRARTYAPPESV
jgi:hypothetical protein